MLTELEVEIFDAAISASANWKRTCEDSGDFPGGSPPQPPAMMVQLLSKAHACILASIKSKAPIHSNYDEASPSEKLLILEQLKAEVEKERSRQN